MASFDVKQMLKLTVACYLLSEGALRSDDLLKAHMEPSSAERSSAGGGGDRAPLTGGGGGGGPGTGGGGGPDDTWTPDPETQQVNMTVCN